MKLAIFLPFALLFGGTVGAMAAALNGLDRHEIRQTINTSFIGLDTAEQGGKFFASAFTVDGQYVDLNGKSFKGQEALAAFARQEELGNGALPKGPTNPVHFVSNEVVTAAPFGAIAQTDVLVATNRKVTSRDSSAGGVTSAIDGGGGIGTVTHGLRYRDELVKTEAGWKIRKRTVSPK